MQIIRNILVALVFLCPIHCTNPDPIVQLPNGKIRGLDRGHYLSFESIPYAEPPVGENRFEPPKPYSQSWSNIRDATQPAAACMQWDQFLFKEDLLRGVEDCLTINVYTPSLLSGTTYPVLVVIHGGGFMFGSASEDGVDFIMEHGKLVVVKMNYRLGPLGFLSTADDVITGNFGLKDQILALEWTKANVAAFNGNPEKITILGFSAGAVSVHLHMMNKNFEKLASGAVSMSGTALSYWSIDRNPIKKALALAKHLNCPTESSISIKKCLQTKEAADIVRAVKEFQKNNLGYNPVIVFGPVIESTNVTNPIITEHPELIIKRGKSAEVPWLTSFVREDGGYNAAELMRKDSNGVEMIEALNERWNELAPVNLYLTNAVEASELEIFANSIRQKYMGDRRFNTENYLLLQKLCTDVFFADGTKKSWALHKEYSHSPVYGYMYDNPPAFGLGNIISNRTDYQFGTVHGDDYYLVIKSPEQGNAPLPEDLKAISGSFVKMIEDFCITGILKFQSCLFTDKSLLIEPLSAMLITKKSCGMIPVDNLP